MLPLLKKHQIIVEDKRLSVQVVPIFIGNASRTVRTYIFKKPERFYCSGFFVGKRQKAKGKRQKAKGKRQKAKGKREEAHGCHFENFTSNSWYLVSRVWYQVVSTQRTNNEQPILRLSFRQNAIAVTGNLMKGSCKVAE